MATCQPHIFSDILVLCVCSPFLIHSLTNSLHFYIRSFVNISGKLVVCTRLSEDSRKGLFTVHWLSGGFGHLSNNGRNKYKSITEVNFARVIHIAAESMTLSGKARRFN